MIKFCLTWLDKRTGKDAFKYVWFEGQETAEAYTQWVYEETGRTIGIRPQTAEYR